MLIAIAISNNGYALQIVNVDITPNITFGPVANNLPGVIGKASDVTLSSGVLEPATKGRVKTD